MLAPCAWITSRWLIYPFRVSRVSGLGFRVSLGLGEGGRQRGKRV